MSIQIVPVTAANEAEWKRRCAASVNQLIQKLSDAQLESLAALEYTGNAGFAIVVNATEDGFELSAAGGGGTTTNALTINNGGAGAASGATFNGSAAVTISYNTVGAAASSHTHASGDITGLASIATSGSASDLSAGTVAAARMPALTGDVTTSAGAVATTLATVNANVGSFGSATAIPVITVNGKGLITAVSTATPTGRQWALVGAGQTAAGVWGQAVDGSKANVDFTGLAGYQDILIIADAVTKSVSGLIQLSVSTDNGSSFYTTSGDYVTVDGNGSRTATTAAFLHATNATLARNGMVRIVGANVSAPKMIEQINNPTAQRLFVASNSAINAVRINGSAGGNLTGGKIYCFAR